MKPVRYSDDVSKNVIAISDVLLYVRTCQCFERILTSRLLFRCATLECEGALLTKAILTDWIVGAIANNYRPDALVDRVTRG